MIPLSYSPTSSVLDPVNPILYVVDPNNQKVHAINYQTKETQSLSFAETPKNIVLNNGNLYVSFPKKIVVYIAETLAKVDEHTFTMDFVDFKVKADRDLLGKNI